MDLFLTTNVETSMPGVDEILSLSNGKKVCLNKDQADFKLELSATVQIFIYGQLFYYIEDGGKIVQLNRGSENVLTDLFKSNDIATVIPRLEGQYLAVTVNSKEKTVCVFGDRYARKESFYSFKDGNFSLGTNLDLIFSEGYFKPEYDQLMLANVFSTYGWYAPKGHTIYANVKQLKAGERILFDGGELKSENIPFEPFKIKDFSEDECETYYEVLRSSIVSRAAYKNDKIWVSSSSGWDSSIILSILVDEFGAENIGMMTGSMVYSEDTGVINRFEMDKINRIGKFFGIKPSVTNMDFLNPSAIEFWKERLPKFKARHSYTATSANFMRISDGVASEAGEGQVVFNGETSDSFHNFGFSQFGTFFHTVKAFTEYADKMNCYLYGPTFLAKVLDGSFEKDKVFQIFKKMIPAEFASDLSSKEDLLESYLLPLFYGSPRLPFTKSIQNPVLTDKGYENVYSFPFRQYMPEVLKSISPENMYSWFIYLYLNFHSQGSTVNIHKHSMELNKHVCASPFNDYRMIKLLSEAPESWGRGLDFNNTKFPLKWVGKNKIKFPYDILHHGPHSYLYDVREGFSLVAEIHYRSAATAFFKEVIAEREYKNLLSDEFINVKYLDGLVEDYLAGKEASGRDFTNLISLLTLTSHGWY